MQATLDAPAVQSASPAPVANPADFIVHRAAMMRFARRKIRDESLAEDAVQDALVSAIASAGSFQGNSAVKTWLIGILNHKIQDAFRREGRYVHLSSEIGDEDDAMDLVRSQREDPSHDMGEDPSAQVARSRLGEALHTAIEDLPDTLRDVFRLQALEGIATTEVCASLGISEANCWVRLHRARKRLAERMQDHY